MKNRINVDRGAMPFVSKPKYKSIGATEESVTEVTESLMNEHAAGHSRFRNRVIS